MRIGIMAGAGDGSNLDQLDRSRRSAPRRPASRRFWLANIFWLRRDHGARASIGRVDAAHRARHRGGADLPAPSARDRAAGAHRQRGQRRALHARHRPLAQDRDRGHVRPLLRAARAPHARVPGGADAAAARRAGRAQGRGVPRARASSRCRAARRCRCWSRRSARRCCGLAGRYADGTITWMTGAKTLGEPHRADAAQGRRARRGAPRRASSPGCRSRWCATPPPRARRRRSSSRSTASCRRTAPCSTARARRHRATWRSSATRRRCARSSRACATRASPTSTRRWRRSSRAPPSARSSSSIEL